MPASSSWPYRHPARPPICARGSRSYGPGVRLESYGNHVTAALAVGKIRRYLFSTIDAIRRSRKLGQHNPQAALHALETTGSLDLSPCMVFAPIYYRGLAYLQSDQPAVAAKEFQRVLDHRSIAPDSLYVVLSELEPATRFRSQGRPGTRWRSMPESVEYGRMPISASFPPASTGLSAEAGIGVFKSREVPNKAAYEFHPFFSK